MAMLVAECVVIFNRHTPFDNSKLWAVVSAFFFAQSVSCGCGGSKKSAKEEDDDCWYELWYFWLIVALFFAGAGIAIAIYCKHHAKHSRLNERDPHVSAQMVMPPAYGVPGHEPPPYHVAMIHPGRPQFVHSRSTGTRPVIQQVQSAQYNQTVSDGSRAISVPPPYSPGQGEARPNQGIVHTTNVTVYGDIVDIDLDYSETYMPHLNNPMPSYFTATNRNAFSSANISNVSGCSRYQEFDCPPAYDYYATTSQSRATDVHETGACRSAARRPISSLQRTVAEATQRANMQRETIGQSESASVVIASSYNLHPMSTTNRNQQSVSASRGRSSNATPVSRMSRISRMSVRNNPSRSHSSQKMPKSSRSTNEANGESGVGTSQSGAPATLGTSCINQQTVRSEQEEPSSSNSAPGPSGITRRADTNDT